MEEIVFNSKEKNPGATSCKKSFSGNGMDDVKFNLTRRKKKLSPEKRKELEKIYERVSVHDYGDEYHMSEEERKKKFKYYEAFTRIKRCKRKFRKLDEFVKVYRLCLETLDIVAQDNMVYPVDKFKKMVLRGDIEVFGLHFPKYIGKDKKTINWDYITEFILDTSRDPKELVTKKTSALDELSSEEQLKQLFSDDEMNDILEAIEEMKNPPKEVYSDKSRIKDGTVVEVAEDSETKELIKTSPEFLRTIKDSIREERAARAINGRLNSFVFEMTADDFEEIERIDAERGYHYDYNIPEFKGDIMNRKDYKKYLMKLKSYEDTQIKESHNGKMRTLEEIRELELKDLLENSGWNVRALYNAKKKEKKLKKAYKRDKKREEKLKKRLIEVQERQKKRGKGKDIEFNSKKKKKKKSKKKQKEGD